ncbi:MAG: peptidylprolyl isomerase, partial [Pseudomonadota bacterium]
MPKTLLTLLAALALALPAMAQTENPSAPAIVVNERAITNYEIAQRALMLSAFGAGGDIRALAREQLITEQLQLEIGDRFELTADETEVEQGAADFARRRELELAAFRIALSRAGIADETFNAFVRAGLTWRNVVQARFRRIATPTESDLDAALELTNRGIRESVLMQELGVPFAGIGEEAATALVRRLSRELNGRGNFGAAVARHSKLPSAARGGRLDWVPIQNLPPALALQILGLEIGEVTAPVQIQEGVSILKLLNRRQEPAPPSDQGPVTLTYSELIIALASNAPAPAVAAAR